MKTGKCPVSEHVCSECGRFPAGLFLMGDCDICKQKGLPVIYNESGYFVLNHHNNPKIKSPFESMKLHCEGKGCLAKNVRVAK